MNSNHLDPKCEGCAFSLGKGVIGSNVRLPGSWSLNHYAGSEGYLGWLALQPYRHLTAFSQLDGDELSHLGPNIAAIERVLKTYWEKTFDDPIERLYIVYFFEGGGSHIHLHLIPRFQSLEPRLRDWNAPRATTSATFPARYRRDASDFQAQVCCIMNYLRANLASTVGKTA